MKRFSCFFDLDFCPDKHTACAGKRGETESRTDQ